MHEFGEVIAELRKALRTVGRHPLRHGRHFAATSSSGPACVAADDELVRKELPLVETKRAGAHPLHQVQGPHDPVRLEQPPPDVVQHRILERGGEQAEALLELGRRELWVVEHLLEHGGKGSQREAVHVVDAGELGHEEEERRAAGGERPVPVPLLVQLHRRFRRQLERLPNLRRELLRAREGLNQRRVLQQVSFRFRQGGQQTRFQLSELELEPFLLLQHLLLLGLELGLLVLDGDAQELPLQPRASDAEVYFHDQRRSVGGQLHFRIARHHAHAEVLVPVHDLFPHHHAASGALLGQVPPRQRVEHRVHAVHVQEEQRLAEPHGQLHLAHEPRVKCRHRLQRSHRVGR
mmetsp:Transcript_59968/g.113047  ORF Transcript_59968/g.113047 Transcript_59968/m.113047 type:complete len:350 (+) Transcript_59968:1209-2258(+)